MKVKQENDWIEFKNERDDGAVIALRSAANWLKKQDMNGSLPGFINVQAMNYQYDPEWHTHTFTVFFVRYVEAREC